MSMKCMEQKRFECDINSKAISNSLQNIREWSTYQALQLVIDMPAILQKDTKGHNHHKK